MKVCIEPDCWQPTAATRCPDHERAWQRARNQRKQKAVYNRRAYRGASLEGLACACCGGTSDLTRHHVVPLNVAPQPLPAWCRGYPVVAMCRPCNSSIADRMMTTRECPKHGGTPGGDVKSSGSGV